MLMLICGAITPRCFIQLSRRRRTRKHISKGAISTVSLFCFTPCSSMSLKRKVLSIKEKVEIIAKVDENPFVSKVALAKSLNLKPSSLNTILKNRATLEIQARETSSKRKKVRHGKYADLEKALSTWFSQARASNIPISGPIIREKAEELALSLHLEFHASNGWIDRFKKRYGILYHQVSGEANSVPQETVDDWVNNTLPGLIKDYEPKNVFNADELGLFYNMLPDKSFMLKGENCHGGKRSKERLTVLLCCNEDGSELIKPLIVGKFKSPRCFKNIKHLPCDYRHNTKAWITGVLFKEFLQKLEAKMRTQNRKIILFVDRCAAHPTDVDYLQNVKVVFFPANCTSRLQPLDQGIIKVVKQHFRKRLVHRLLRHMENAGRAIDIATVPKANVLDAMHYLAASWSKITRQTVSNCFRKSGFRQVENAGEEPGDEELTTDEDDGWINGEDWRMLQDRLDFEGSFEEFVDADNMVATCNLQSIHEVFEQQQISQGIGLLEPTDSGSDDDEIVEPPPSFNQAMDGLQLFLRYMSSCSNVPDYVYEHVHHLEDEIVKQAHQKKKQSTLDQFLLKA